MVLNGDIRDVFVWTDPANPNSHRAWTCEDGARIRYWDSAAGSWSFQTTDNSATQALLDIYVRAGSDGWACGKGGTILHDSTTGGTWSALSTVMDTTVSPSVPAVLWGIRFATSLDGYLCGDHVLRWTDDTGSSWHDATLPSGLAMADAKFYAVEIVPGSSFETVVGVEVEDDASLMLYSGDGKTWSKATMYDASGTVVRLPEEFDTWDIVFEPNTGSVATAVGYMVGGVGSNDGRIYRTQDGGVTWHQETTSPGSIETMYGAHAWSGGEGLACGYQGQVYKRSPSTGVWTKIHPSGGPDPCNASGPFTAPLNGVTGDNAGNVWMVGSFGSLRTSSDGGTTLTQAITEGGHIWRLSSSYLKSSTEGWVAGEVGVHHMDLTASPALQWTTELCTYLQTWVKALAIKSSGAGDEGWAVGYGHTSSDPAIWHRSTSGSWSAETSGVPTTAVLYAVATLPSGGAVAVGYGGLVLRRDASSSTWTQIAAPTGSPQLNGVASASNGVVFMVGSGGKAFRSPSNFETLSSTSPGWVDVSPSSTAGLNAVSLRSSTEIYACGDGGTIVKYNRPADQFQAVSGAPASADYFGISLVPSSTEIWVGGAYGTMVHFDGSSWSTVNCHTSKAVQGLSFLDSGNGLAVGKQNVDPEGSVGDGLAIKFY